MSHFYHPDGRSCHEMPTVSKGAKSPTRPTTIADAKRLGLLPSVSTITKVLHAPGLETYKMKEVAKACFLNPPHPGEEMDPYVKAMVEKSSEDAAGAADVGTIVHDALECSFTGEQRKAESVKIGHMEYHIDTFVHPALELIKQHGWEIVASEKTLVNLAEGYAGTTDLIIKTREGEIGIADFKTKRTKVGKAVEPSETHPCQIAAYSMAHWSALGFGANIYISTTEPGRVEIVPYSHQELYAAWQAFLDMNSLYRWLNNYDARKQ